MRLAFWLMDDSCIWLDSYDWSEADWSEAVMRWLKEESFSLMLGLCTVPHLGWFFWFMGVFFPFLIFTHPFEQPILPLSLPVEITACIRRCRIKTWTVLKSDVSFLFLFSFSSHHLNSQSCHWKLLPHHQVTRSYCLIIMSLEIITSHL